MLDLHVQRSAQTAAARLQVALSPAALRQVHFEIDGRLDRAEDTAKTTDLGIDALGGANGGGSICTFCRSAFPRASQETTGTTGCNSASPAACDSSAGTNASKST